MIVPFSIQKYLFQYFLFYLRNISILKILVFAYLFSPLSFQGCVRKFLTLALHTADASNLMGAFAILLAFSQCFW